MKRVVPVVLVLVILALASCKKKETDPSMFVGNWQEREQVPQFSGTTYSVIFSSNGRFRMREYAFTDIVLLPGQSDSCSYSHTNYMRGHYTVAGPDLVLSGEYCNSSFDTVLAGCAGQTTFHAQYAFNFFDGRLVLSRGEDEVSRMVMEKQ